MIEHAITVGVRMLTAEKETWKWTEKGNSMVGVMGEDMTRVRIEVIEYTDLTSSISVLLDDEDGTHVCLAMKPAEARKLALAILANGVVNPQRN